MSDLASRQFSPRAAAYVSSAVHAAGADLEALKSFVTAQGFARVLDLGCGGGHVSFTMAPHAGAVVAYDLSQAMLAVVAQEAQSRGLTNISTVQGAAETLPFANASFDFVATRYSAHHWLDVPAALHEVHRVLKPGGALMVMDGVAPEDPASDTFLQTIEMLRDPSHVRDYSVREWEAMLREAGFTPEPPVRARLRLEFKSWIARMQTPAVLSTAITALQATAQDSVRARLGLEPDGSFQLDTASILARR
ncbi:SAM-dependent methyltransferase [Rhizomicrobium palustre]|uniref:SAM-dependent methyltransferase n=1 Tax=Rhizomicrobium palustre TaxID=189966 RepID=A0A846MV47_9PROT|nr:class I SAM-dependent methyltransferase [Rhizomicrobium palustre]NIK87233.1 SAM-dependent methyltransferase [Rhizomicrobium palustre]